MENLNDIPEGAYLALPAELMLNFMNVLELCVDALNSMDPHDRDQMQIKEDALNSAYALINAQSELH